MKELLAILIGLVVVIVISLIAIHKPAPTHTVYIQEPKQ